MDYSSRPSAKNVLPLADETSIQMSPFSDERWDIDQYENKRRKEIHRSYIFDERNKISNSLTDHQTTKDRQVFNAEKQQVQEQQQQQQEQKEPNLTEEIQAPKVDRVMSPPSSIEELKSTTVEPQYFRNSRKTPLFKSKTLDEIEFEKPGPVNLYPLLKCPVERVKPKFVYAASNNKEQWLGSPTRVADPHETRVPPRPQFTVYKDVLPDRPKALHYGVHVPFWQF